MVVYDLHGLNVVWFHESHKLDHIIAIVWQSGRVKVGEGILMNKNLT